MKISTRSALLALALCGTLLAVASASAQHNVPGHPHSHPHAATAAQASLTRIRKLGRGLLTDQAATKVDPSSPQLEAAKAAKATNVVQKALQWGWNSWGNGGWGGGYDDHDHGSWGGAVSQPPPGAPVYYPPSYAPHGDHYDYIPGHYHNGRKLMADGEKKVKSPAIKQPAPVAAAKPHAATPAAPASKAAQPAAPTKPVQKRAAVKQTESAQAAESTDHNNHGGWGGYGQGHYDYYGPSYVPHGDHYDYVPSHYHYHEGTHGHGDWGWGRRL